MMKSWKRAERERRRKRRSARTRARLKLRNLARVVWQSEILPPKAKARFALFQSTFLLFSHLTVPSSENIWQLVSSSVTTAKPSTTYQFEQRRANMPLATSVLGYASLGFITRCYALGIQKRNILDSKSTK